MREIIFYIVCVGGSDIYKRRYGWDYLFRKVVKEYGAGNLIIRRNRNKLAIDFFRKCERAKE